MGPTRLAETSVTNYQYTLRNIPEERIFQVPRSDMHEDSKFLIQICCYLSPNHAVFCMCCNLCPFLGSRNLSSQFLRCLFTAVPVLGVPLAAQRTPYGDITFVNLCFCHHIRYRNVSGILGKSGIGFFFVHIVVEKARIS
jgi:hypothetical protein